MKKAFLIPLFLLIAISMTGCTDQTNNTNSANSPTATANPVKNLQITTLTQGTGAAITKSGDSVNVNYKGPIMYGEQFDSTDNTYQPYAFTLGHQKVIRGWDIGLLGMKVGEVRRLVIPPSLAYGDQDYGPIKANSTLVFEVELLSIN